jgi:hypothetical protein
VVNGDGPLISDGTLGELVDRHSSAGVGPRSSWPSWRTRAASGG